MTEPQNPFSQQAAGAVALHELYLSYVEAGFTEMQALQLICAMMAAMIGRSQ